MENLRFLHIAANTKLGLPCMNVAIGSAKPGEAVSLQCDGSKYEAVANKKGIVRIPIRENPNTIQTLSFS